ncbi:MAG TPA: extracellular solute-binding protein [Clostridiales bacterium]|nr:extracellular solute-binding protein [Clostridiales bacterium]
MKKSLKVLVSVILICILASSVVLLVACQKDNVDVDKPVEGKQVLHILNWGDYIAKADDNFDSVVKEFEKANPGVQVIYITADTNELMLNMLNGDAKVDILCPSDYAIEKLIKEDKIQKLDLSKLPNIANVEQKLYEKMNNVFGDNNGKGSMNEYTVPYMYGTLGVMYNTKAVTPEDAEKAGYGLLWNHLQNEKLEKKVLMKDSVRDAMVATVLYLKETKKLPDKYDKMPIEELINNTDDELLKLIEDCLIEQKKNKALKKYEVDDGKGEMEKGDAYANLAWSGDAIASMWKNEDLDYFVPEVGGNIWYDGWVIAKGSTNVDLAHKFIDFLCDPVIAARNSMYIGYTSAVKQDALRNSEDAVEIIKDELEIDDIEEYFNDEIAYPNLDNQNLAVMRDFGDKESDIITMWERVKNYGNTSKILGIVFGVLAGVIVIVVVVVIVLKKTSRKGKITKFADSSKESEEDEDDDYDEEEDDEESEEEDSEDGNDEEKIGDDE